MNFKKELLVEIAILAFLFVGFLGTLAYFTSRAIYFDGIYNEQEKLNR